MSFFPMYINAGAELTRGKAPEPSGNKRPTLLIVNNVDVFDAAVNGFYNVLHDFMGETFDIDQHRLVLPLPQNTRDAYYIFVVYYAFDYREGNMLKEFNEYGLDRFDNKALVIILAPDSKPINISDKVRALFAGGVHWLLCDWSGECESDNFEQTFLRNLIDKYKQESRQVPQRIQKQKKEVAISQELQQKMNAFYEKLEKINSDLAAEYFEIISQLQSH